MKAPYALIVLLCALLIVNSCKNDDFHALKIENGTRPLYLLYHACKIRLVPNLETLSFLGYNNYQVMTMEVLGRHLKHLIPKESTGINKIHTYIHTHAYTYMY